jgi:hypothetical protein
MPMSIVDKTADSYFAMWNETDPTRRRELIESTWTAEARSSDPMADVSGYEQIDAMVAGVQKSAPNHRFRRSSAIDLHHERARFGWEMIAPNGAIAVSGIDVVVVAEDGRFSDLVGFFGPLAP